MRGIEAIYHLLHLKNKISDRVQRMLYLRHSWGLEQETIARLEGLTQSRVSALMKGQPIPDIRPQFTATEVRTIQALPRETISDVQVIAFVYYILGLSVSHPFHHAYKRNKGVCIAALSAMGIQQRFLAKLFDSSDAHASLSVKRNTEKALNTTYEMRFDTDSTVFDVEYITKPTQQNKHFFIFGGE